MSTTSTHPDYSVARGPWPIDSYVVTCFIAFKDTPRGVSEDEVDVVFTGRGRPNFAQVKRTALAECREGAYVRRMRRAW